MKSFGGWHLKTRLLGDFHERQLLLNCHRARFVTVRSSHRSKRFPKCRNICNGSVFNRQIDLPPKLNWILKMRVQAVSLVVLAAMAVVPTAVTAAEPGPKIAPKIAWYGTLATGLEEAARSKRPILLVAAAPHCLGVPGIW